MGQTWGAARSRIMGEKVTFMADGEWEYPKVVLSLESHVVCHPSYKIGTKADRRLGMIQIMILWDQYVKHKYEEETEILV